MGWKGAIRSLQASARSAERESRRRHNELQRQRKQLEKMLETERAAYEVAFYNNRIDLLRSVQKQCGPAWDWHGVRATPPPKEPNRLRTNEMAARTALQNFQPNFLHKLFKRVESKRQSLGRAIDVALKVDEEAHQEALRLYKQQYAEWRESQDLAGRILSGDLQAYLEVINEVSPLKEISELGSRLEFHSHNGSSIEVILHVNGEDVIPSEVKTQLQSGKLSVKKMPQGQFYELYQDYVCGCVLRVARELFALLPFDVAIVTATGNVLNSQTGHIEEQPILSAAIQRKTLERLNLSMIDPSDSFKNFVHEMDFKKPRGFKPVKKIDPSSLVLSH
jgi:hypothetical protein